MMNHEQNRIEVEEHLIATDTTEALEQAAVLAAMQLKMWRSRFTAGANGETVRAEYETAPDTRVTIESSSDEAVSITHTDPDGVATAYRFDVASREVQVIPSADAAVPPQYSGDKLSLFNAASRFLFDADRQEARG